MFPYIKPKSRHSYHNQNHTIVSFPLYYFILIGPDGCYSTQNLIYLILVKLRQKMANTIISINGKIIKKPHSLKAYGTTDYAGKIIINLKIFTSRYD